MPFSPTQLRHDADHATSLQRLRAIVEQTIKIAEEYHTLLQRHVEAMGDDCVCTGHFLCLNCATKDALAHGGF